MLSPVASIQAYRSLAVADAPTLPQRRGFPDAPSDAGWKVVSNATATGGAEGVNSEVIKDIFGRATPVELDFTQVEKA